MIPRHVTIPVIAALALALGVSACSKPVPEPGVINGGASFEKKDFCETSNMGDIRSIAFGRLDRDSLEVVVAAGTKGAAVFMPSGRLRRSVGFDRPVARTVPLDMDRDGVSEFMGRGGDGQAVALMNRQGQTIWELSRIDSRVPADMTACDLDGDGFLDFVVALSGGGIRVLNDTATERAKWDSPKTSSIEAIDIDGDGRPEILSGMGVKPGIQVRDASGKVLRTIDGVGEPFTVIRRKGETGGNAILGSVKGKPLLRVVDLSGANIRELPVPVSGGRYPSAVTITFAPGGDPFLAVTLTLSAEKQRSFFAIYDGAGRPVYQEVFAASHIAVAAMRDSTAGTDTLLLGAGAQVWMIAPNK